MSLLDIFRGKKTSSDDYAQGIAELDQKLLDIDRDLADAEITLTEAQRQALLGKEPANLGALHARVQTLKDRRRVAENAKQDLLGKLREVLPGERRARLKQLQQEETQLLVAQKEARTGLLETLARLLVLAEEIEGLSVKVGPFRSLAELSLLDGLKKARNAELVAMIEKFREDRPEGVALKLKRLRHEKARLQEQTSEEEILGLVETARSVAEA
jgi:hypothetical protein